VIAAILVGMNALSNDLRMRMRRLDVLVQRLSAAERLFRGCDTRIDVQLHAMDRQAYRDALHEAILALQRAKRALVAAVHRA
jgi:hypothetical protein